MMRTPFCGERGVRAVRGGCGRVVLLGAGRDGRGFRLGLPAGVTVFEVDQGPVLEFKDAVLAKHDAVPTGRRVPVVADLRAGWPQALAAAGFDTPGPALSGAPGLLPPPPAPPSYPPLDTTAPI